MFTDLMNLEYQIYNFDKYIDKQIISRKPQPIKPIYTQNNNSIIIIYINYR